MTWSTFGTHTSGSPLLPGDGDKIDKNVKQIAEDVYINPVAKNDGEPEFIWPLEMLAPVFSGHVSGTGTTGVNVDLPENYSPEDPDDYEVLLAWQENPGSNGQLWVEKAVDSFSIKHSGSETGKKIAYQIVRKTV